MSELKYPVKSDVIRISSGIFWSLSGDSSTTKGVLTDLRKSGLKPLVDAPDAWPVVYRNNPFGEYSEKQASLLSESLFSALHLYSVHRRTNSQPFRAASSGGLNVGGALASLHKSRPNPKSIEAKALAVFSASTPQQTLRLLAPLLRMSSGVSIDYGNLVWDIYSLSGPFARQVTMGWAKSYYRATPSI